MKLLPCHGQFLQLFFPSMTSLRLFLAFSFSLRFSTICSYWYLQDFLTRANMRAALIADTPNLAIKTLFSDMGGGNPYLWVWPLHPYIAG
jgi:hypothetical protein